LLGWLPKERTKGRNFEEKTMKNPRPDTLPSLSALQTVVQTGDGVLSTLTMLELTHPPGELFVPIPNHHLVILPERPLLLSFAPLPARTDV
jgi:hypothetical protein